MTNYGVSEILKVVDSAITVEATAIKVVPMLHGGFMGVLNATALMVHAGPAIAQLANLNLTELKNELVNLDPVEDQTILDEISKMMGQEGQSGASTITTVVSLVEQSYHLVQSWVTTVKQLFAKTPTPSVPATTPATAPTSA